MGIEEVEKQEGRAITVFRQPPHGAVDDRLGAGVLLGVEGVKPTLEVVELRYEDVRSEGPAEVARRGKELGCRSDRRGDRLALLSGPMNRRKRRRQHRGVGGQSPVRGTLRLPEGHAIAGEAVEVRCGVPPVPEVPQVGSARKVSMLIHSTDDGTPGPGGETRLEPRMPPQDAGRGRCRADDAGPDRSRLEAKADPAAGKLPQFDALVRPFRPGLRFAAQQGPALASEIALIWNSTRTAGAPSGTPSASFRTPVAGGNASDTAGTSRSVLRSHAAAAGAARSRPLAAPSSAPGPARRGCRHRAANRPRLLQPLHQVDGGCRDRAHSAGEDRQSQRHHGQGEDPQNARASHGASWCRSRPAASWDGSLRRRSWSDATASAVRPDLEYASASWYRASPLLRIELHGLAEGVDRLDPVAALEREQAQPDPCRAVARSSSALENSVSARSTIPSSFRR